MAMWAMVATAVLSAASTVMSSEQQRIQQEAQADAMEAQANVTRQQAQLQQQKGDIEARNIERQKRQLRREFETAQGHNRSLLAAGNVDMTSGSALDVSLGNIDRFAAEMGQNAYDVALKKWETAEQVKATNYQADVYDAQGSYLSSTAGSLGTSLLKGAIQGGLTFASMYGSSAFSGAGAGAGTAESPATSYSLGQGGALTTTKQWNTGWGPWGTAHKTTTTSLPV